MKWQRDGHGESGVVTPYSLLTAARRGRLSRTDRTAPRRKFCFSVCSSECRLYDIGNVWRFQPSANGRLRPSFRAGSRRQPERTNGYSLR